MPPTGEARIDFKPGFREAFEAENIGLARTPHPRTGGSVTALERALETFLEHKITRPPQPLPRRFRDHALGGALSRYRECHLAGDTLLIYRDERGVVSLFTVVDHDDELRGGRGRALARRLKRLLGEG